MKRIVSWGLVLLLLCIPILALGATVNLSWNANSEPDLAGYKVYNYHGPCPTNGFALPGPEVGAVGVVPNPSYSFSVPDTLAIVCATVTAFDTSGNESAQAAPVQKQFFVPTPLPRITGMTVTPDSFIVTFSADTAKVRFTGDGFTMFEVPVPANSNGTLTAQKLRDLNSTWACSAAVRADGQVNDNPAETRCGDAVPSPTLPPPPPTDTTPPSVPTGLDFACTGTGPCVDARGTWHLSNGFVFLNDVQFPGGPNNVELRKLSGQVHVKGIEGHWWNWNPADSAWIDLGI